MYIQRRKITAGEDGEVAVAPEATDLLFEVEDVAQLVAEVTGQDVEVTADGDQVEFGVGEDVYTVTAEEDTEVVESSRKTIAGRNKPVTASNKRPGARRPSSKVVRRVSK